MEHGHEHGVNSAWKQFKLLNYLQRSACHHLGTQSVNDVILSKCIQALGSWCCHHPPSLIVFCPPTDLKLARMTLRLIKSLTRPPLDLLPSTWGAQRRQELKELGGDCCNSS